jgi:hypothetical protein
MPIIDTDIQVRLSGGSANVDAGASLGGAKSSTVIVDDVLNNLWDNVGGIESGAGDIEYRCVYIHNAHATLTMINAKVYLDALTDSSDDEVDIGLGTSLVGSATEEQLVANETTAPTGVTFSRPTSYATGLLIGDIEPGEHKAVWIRRTVNAGAAAFTNNGYDLAVESETLA